MSPHPQLRPVPVYVPVDVGWTGTLSWSCSAAQLHQETCAGAYSKTHKALAGCQEKKSKTQEKEMKITRRCYNL